MWKSTSIFLVTTLGIALAMPTVNQTNLNELCQSHDKNTVDMYENRVLLDHLLVDEYNKAIYCHVPNAIHEPFKRLTTSFGNNSDIPTILVLQDRRHHQYNLLKPLSSYSKQEAEFRVRNYLKVLMTSHPFQRLLTFYRHNVEKRQPEGSYKTKLKSSKGFHKLTKLMKGTDFVDFIRNAGNYGLFTGSLRPAFQLCQPCQVNYDVIGKYEAKSDDLNRNEERVFNQPFNSLSHEMLVHLNIIYEEDFAFFDFQYFDKK